MSVGLIGVYKRTKFKESFGKTIMGETKHHTAAFVPKLCSIYGSFVSVAIETGICKGSAAIATLPLREGASRILNQSFTVCDVNIVYFAC